MEIRKRFPLKIKAVYRDQKSEEWLKDGTLRTRLCPTLLSKGHKEEKKSKERREIKYALRHPNM